jgi:hypothetical protein
VSHALRAEPTTHLTDEQRTARQLALDWLDEYRAAGVFPHNHVRPGERVSVFVDPHGTPCAVGYLMLRSGEEQLVEEIVRTDNLIRVHELRDDPRVAAWLQAHGLTLDDAALIQPQYTGLPSPQPSDPPAARSYVPVTVGLSLATAALVSFVATTSPRSGSPWVDVLAVGTSMGQVYLVRDASETTAREPRWAEALNMVGFLASIGAEVVRISGQIEDAEGDSRPAVALRPYVAPGPYGTEIGFALRH